MKTTMKLSICPPPRVHFKAGEMYIASTKKDNPEKVIVLCTSSSNCISFSGVVVHCEDDIFTPGYYSTTWIAAIFTPFHGTITLEA